ncbi:unnamed protein product [Arctia plantaginis]|uniref:Dynein regulatory complex protein 9 n=1 Tax=Arctia plantaginis TaxID=874455 RepID=A0A8S1BQ20_ARCPL|nr:unnamed protein product [Arctia plantaginis]CAB3260472.1 unnamed protein product [Arctia plantaginis]
MSLDTHCNQSKNVCLSLFHEDDNDGGPRLTRELSLRLLTAPNLHSATSRTSNSVATSKTCMDSATHIHLFATIIEDILIQLRILGECNNEMHFYKTQFVMQGLLEEKFGVESFDHQDELLEIDPKNLENDVYKLRKHAADRNTCITVLTHTYLGLTKYGTFEALVNYRQDAEDRMDHFLFLIDEEARNKEMRRSLRRQVRQQRIRIKSCIYETNQIVDELISRLEDETVKRSTQERYTEKWESSRTEQNNKRIQDKEASFSSTITKYQNKADDEQRVHSEVENIINITVYETLRKIEECMSKYDKDMEDLEVKITTMRLNYEKQVEKRIELEQKLAEHDVEMKNFIQFKVEREKVRAYQRKMANAAIIVQAWWRGLLVRLELGPFKPSLQKKKRNKKKKK